MEAAEILMRTNDISGFEIVKGRAKAILPEERELKYYQRTTTGSREYDVALEERIRRPMEEGMLIVKNPDGSVKFDDRKLRFDGITFRHGKYLISVGPTHFGEVQSTDKRAQNDIEFLRRLMEKGIKDFGDPKAYFAAAFAVNAVPVTEEGYVHLFRRSKGAEIYPGYWHVIGGMLDTDLTLFDHGNNASEIVRGRISENMKREFVEEMGMPNVNLRLTGLVYQLADTADFTFVAQINAGSNEFVTGKERALEGMDHSDVAVLKSADEVRDFMKREEKIAPVGKGSLELYLESLKNT